MSGQILALRAEQNNTKRKSQRQKTNLKSLGCACCALMLTDVLTRHTDSGILGFFAPNGWNALFAVKLASACFCHIGRSRKMRADLG